MIPAGFSVARSFLCVSVCWCGASVIQGLTTLLGSRVPGPGSHNPGVQGPGCGPFVEIVKTVTGASC